MPLPRPMQEEHGRQDPPLGRLWLGCIVYRGADSPGLTAPRTASVGP